MSSPTTSSGTAFALIDRTLRRFPEYRAWRAGLLTRDGYCAWVASQRDTLSATGLDDDMQHLSTRFPADDHSFVMDVLADLADAGLVPEARYPRPEFERLANLVVDRFEHAGRTTFIFPEEARLLFALAHQVRPRNAVFLGSYYGYWAIWAAPAVLASGGRMTLVDVDADAMATARSNMAALGFADSVDFVVADAIDFAQHQLRDVDLCVLDAEGPKEGPVPDLLDKAIYFPITQAVTPALLPNALLVAHNVLLQNLTANAYFAGRIEHNRAQFGKWMTHLTEHYNVHRVYPSSEGTGVYRKLGSPCAGW